MILITAFLTIQASLETEDQLILVSTCFQEILKERHLLFLLTAIILDSHIQLTDEAHNCQQILTGRTEAFPSIQTGETLDIQVTQETEEIVIRKRESMSLPN